MIRSANRFLRYRADGDRMVLTVEAHAVVEAGAPAAAIREVAKMYPLEKWEVVGPWHIASVT